MHQVCECSKSIDWCKQKCTKDPYCKGYVKTSGVTNAKTGQSLGWINDNHDTVTTALCWLVEGACVDYAVGIVNFFGNFIPKGEKKESRRPPKKLEICQMATTNPNGCPNGCRRIQTTNGNVGKLNKDKVCGLKKCGKNKKQMCHKGCFIKQF